MKNIKQVVSVMLWLMLIVSAILNVLYMFNIISWGTARLANAVFIALLFIVSAAGLILKEMRGEDMVQLNIITPIREIGPLYVWTLIIWFISCAVVLLLRWHIIRIY